LFNFQLLLLTLISKNITISKILEFLSLMLNICQSRSCFYDKIKTSKKLETFIFISNFLETA